MALSAQVLIKSWLVVFFFFFFHFFFFITPLPAVFPVQHCRGLSGKLEASEAIKLKLPQIPTAKGYPGKKKKKNPPVDACAWKGS